MAAFIRLGVRGGRHGHLQLRDRAADALRVSIESLTAAVVALTSLLTVLDRRFARSSRARALAATRAHVDSQEAVLEHGDR